MPGKPADRIHDFQVFGEYGGVNPSITDSSTFTFMTTDKMKQLFSEEVEGCYLYSRHMNPSCSFLSDALARMENTEEAQVTASGMGAITSTLMQITQTGDEIISCRTIYGGTYAFLKNFFPKFGVKTHFVDITDHEYIKSLINDKTKAIYCETVSNPLLEVADIPKLRKIADEAGIMLIVDNTFTPLIVTPADLGAHVVVHSLTKFVNGASDCVGGAVCGSYDFVSSMRSVNDGAAMLLGPAPDSFRAASILKNMRHLHIRMTRHSKNAAYVAENLVKLGIKVHYPGLESHPQHELFKELMNEEYGFGGMITIDAKTEEQAGKLMEAMQNAKVGYFAVSLGFYKTLFSSPGSSTSSEIPKEEQEKMGLTDGLVRFSVGIDQHIERSFDRIKDCLKEVGLV